MAAMTKMPHPRLNSLDDLLKLNDTNTEGNVAKPFPQDGGNPLPIPSSHIFSLMGAIVHF